MILLYRRLPEVDSTTARTYCVLCRLVGRFMAIISQFVNASLHWHAWQSVILAINSDTFSRIVVSDFDGTMTNVLWAECGDRVWFVVLRQTYTFLRRGLFV